MRSFMAAISSVFHPLLMATYACLIFWWIFPGFFSPVNSAAIPYLIFAIFTTTFLIPAGSVLLMLYTRKITNLELTNRYERIFPFITIALFYGITTYLFHTKMPVSVGLLNLMTAVSLLIALIALISLFFKISVHATAIWGLCGILTIVVIRYLGAEGILILLLVFPAAGLTGMSRLYLGRHSPKEVWAGSAVGYVSCLVAAYMLL